MAVNPFDSAPATPAPEAQTPAPQATQAAPSLNNGTQSAPPATPVFNNGSTGGGEKITDYAGSPLIIRPFRYEADVSTEYGPANVVEADWVLLDGSDNGEVHTGKVFSGVLVNSLRKYLESPNPLTLGVIGQGVAKPGRSAPWVLNEIDPSYQDVAIKVAQANNWV